MLRWGFGDKNMGLSEGRMDIVCNRVLYMPKWLLEGWFVGKRSSKGVVIDRNGPWLCRILPTSVIIPLSAVQCASVFNKKGGLKELWFIGERWFNDMIYIKRVCNSNSLPREELL